MTLAECRPGRKVCFDAPLSESRQSAPIDYREPHAREGWVLYANKAPLGMHEGPGFSHTTDLCPEICGGPSPHLPPQRVTVQYWSPLRCVWLTEQFTPEQLTPAPEFATDDVPGRPA